MQLQSQVTNKVPVFEVSHLQPGSTLKLYLYAENAKGVSEPVVLEEAVPNQQKHIVEGGYQIGHSCHFPFSPLTSRL